MIISAEVCPPPPPVPQLFSKLNVSVPPVTMGRFRIHGTFTWICLPGLGFQAPGWVWTLPQSLLSLQNTASFLSCSHVFLTAECFIETGTVKPLTCCSYIMRKPSSFCSLVACGLASGMSAKENKRNLKNWSIFACLIKLRDIWGSGISRTEKKLSIVNA